MISQRELKKRYDLMMLSVTNDDYYKIDLTNRVNCYVCGCGHITKTKDVDAGCTPMMFTCESCGKLATSTFYKDIAPEQTPTFEWYRPSLKQIQKMRNNPESLDHVLSGGLVRRQI